MNFKELCLKRESIRSYTTHEVEQEKLDYIFECVRIAPSAVNFQPWKFYIVRDTVSKSKLCECYNREWFKTAPMYIIACVRHDQEWVRKSDKKTHGSIDIAIAVEHLCLSATEQGLGTCWVCNFDVNLCCSHFQFPDEEEPIVLIPIGYSAVETSKSKTRKNISEIVSNL